MVSKDKTEETHESYALMGFTRTHGGNNALFGSSIRHNDTVMMTIRRAEVCRDINHDWYHARERLIEVEMSALQFAELITTMNVGDGVPVTLRHYGGPRLEDPPFRDRRELVRSEFKGKTEEVVSDLRTLLSDVTRIFGEGTVKKQDKDKIIKELQTAIMQVTNNLPYVTECFEKTVTQTINEAKSEVEAFVTGAVQRAGLAALGRGEQPVELLLEDKNN